MTRESDDQRPWLDDIIDRAKIASLKQFDKNETADNSAGDDTQIGDQYDEKPHIAYNLGDDWGKD